MHLTKCICTCFSFLWYYCHKSKLFKVRFTLTSDAMGWSTTIDQIGYIILPNSGWQDPHGTPLLPKINKNKIFQKKYPK